MVLILESRRPVGRCIRDDSPTCSMHRRRSCPTPVRDEGGAAIVDDLGEEAGGGLDPGHIMKGFVPGDPVGALDEYLQQYREEEPRIAPARRAVMRLCKPELSDLRSLCTS